MSDTKPVLRSLWLSPHAGLVCLASAVACFVSAGVLGWLTLSNDATTRAVMEGVPSPTMRWCAAIAVALCVVGFAASLCAFVLGPTHIRRWSTAVTLLLGFPSLAIAALDVLLLR